MSPKTVTMLGGGDSEISLEGEIWGINNNYTIFPGVIFSRIFEIHPFSLSQNGWLRKGSSIFRDKPIDVYIQELNALNVPIYTQEILPLNPFTRAVVLPLENLKARFRHFFDATMSYMLALAIMEGFTQIRLGGIDLCTTQEYIEQKASVTYFCGLAEGLGIEVITGKDSPLLESDSFYGFTEGKRKLWHHRVEAMRQYINTESQKHHDMLEQYKGAANCLKNMVDFYTLLIKEK